MGVETPKPVVHKDVAAPKKAVLAAVTSKPTATKHKAAVAQKKPKAVPAVHKKVTAKVHKEAAKPKPTQVAKASIKKKVQHKQRIHLPMTMTTLQLQQHLKSMSQLPW